AERVVAWAGHVVRKNSRQQLEDRMRDSRPTLAAGGSIFEMVLDAFVGDSPITAQSSGEPNAHYQYRQTDRRDEAPPKLARRLVLKADNEINEPAAAPPNFAEIESGSDLADFVANPVRQQRCFRIVEDDRLFLV